MKRNTVYQEEKEGMSCKYISYSSPLGSLSLLFYFLKKYEYYMNLFI